MLDHQFILFFEIWVTGSLLMGDPSIFPRNLLFSDEFNAIRNIETGIALLVNFAKFLLIHFPSSGGLKRLFPLINLQPCGRGGRGDRDIFKCAERGQSGARFRRLM